MFIVNFILTAITLEKFVKKSKPIFDILSNAFAHLLHVKALLLSILLLLPLPSKAGFIANLFEDRRAKLSLYSREKTRFVVQNLATHTLFLYEVVCEKEDKCKNVLIMQTPMVIGANKKGSKSNAGVAIISDWAKLYTDGDKKYPPWGSVKPVPPVGAPFEEWAGKGGDFGYYTAITFDSLIDPKKFDPNKVDLESKNFKSSGNFIHGTKGHAQDLERFILPYKDKKGRLIQRESHACTRVSNQAILFLRNFLDQGSYVISVYAIEAGPKQGSRKDHFRYVFTEGKDQGFFGMGTVNGEVKIIEQGVFDYEIVPLATPMTEPGQQTPQRPFINPYKIALKDFKGHFNTVDGVLSDDYKVPKGIKETNVPYPEFIRPKKK